MRWIENPETVERRLAAIASDRRRGATELALKALRVLAMARPCGGASAGQYERDINKLARRLTNLRPAMSPIRSIMERAMFDLSGTRYDSASTAHLLLKRICAAVAQDVADARTQMAAHFEERFGQIKHPICVSYSSSVIAAIGVLSKPRVFVCESRPLMEGRRTAALLRTVSSSVTIITEAQIGGVMPECDGVVLGCDAIQSDGSIANKAGSYLLALAARDHGSPVVVVGDTYKICSSQPEFESQPVSQVWRGAPSGIGVRNRVFEHVPSRLVNYIVLENGVFRSGRIRSLWNKLQKRRARL